MKTIHKYVLSAASDDQKVAMPHDATILSVQLQNGRICIWAEINDEALNIAGDGRRFIIVGTGHYFPKDVKARDRVHIATVQDGAFVWHIFEVLR